VNYVIDNIATVVLIRLTHTSCVGIERHAALLIPMPHRRLTEGTGHELIRIIVF